jgi:hypothetical protein
VQPCRQWTTAQKEDDKLVAIMSDESARGPAEAPDGGGHFGGSRREPASLAAREPSAASRNQSDEAGEKPELSEE